MKRWEAQRSLWAAQPFFAFCIKLGKRDKERDFFPSNTGGPIVRRTTSFYNKDFSFPIGERAVKFPNVMRWMAER